jgi:hypothetical protein
MKLTGKCKEDFEKWYLKDIDIDECDMFDNDMMLLIFYTEIESMQYGVLVDFFDSVGIDVNIIRTSKSKKIRYTYEIYKQEKILHPKFSVYNVLNYKPEARTAAIEKANELYNL